MLSVFVDGHWWILIMVVGGRGRSSMEVLNLCGQMLALINGSDGDSSKVGVVPLCL
jgi:hypothetical protein